MGIFAKIAEERNEREYLNTKRDLNHIKRELLLLRDAFENFWVLEKEFEHFDRRQYFFRNLQIYPRYKLEIRLDSWDRYHKSEAEEGIAETIAEAEKFVKVGKKFMSLSDDERERYSAAASIYGDWVRCYQEEERAEEALRQLKRSVEQIDAAYKLFESIRDHIIESHSWRLRNEIESAYGSCFFGDPSERFEKLEQSYKRMEEYMESARWKNKSWH